MAIGALGAERPVANELEATRTHLVVARGALQARVGFAQGEAGIVVVEGAERGAIRDVATRAIGRLAAGIELAGVRVVVAIRAGRAERGGPGAAVLIGNTQRFVASGASGAAVLVNEREARPAAVVEGLGQRAERARSVATRAAFASLDTRREPGRVETRRVRIVVAGGAPFELAEVLFDATERAAGVVRFARERVARRAFFLRVGSVDGEARPAAVIEA